MLNTFLKAVEFLLDAAPKIAANGTEFYAAGMLMLWSIICAPSLADQTT
jgi:hypothetical protein